MLKRVGPSNSAFSCGVEAEGEGVENAVAPVQNQQGWGNVMYIPAAPDCDKNRAYASAMVEDWQAGKSPADFPAEHYEQGWTERFAEADLNDIGRRALGLEVAR